MYKSFPGGADRSRNIVFLDLELTALPSHPDSKILEVAIVITTEEFVELERKEWCVKTSRFELEELSKWHQLHFNSVREGGNGLFDDVLSERSLPLHEVTEEVMTTL